MNGFIPRPEEVEAALFDFSDVVATMRMAFAGEPGTSPYKVELNIEVTEGITALRAAGFKTALVTNNDREAFLHHFPEVPLRDLFDVDVFSSDVGTSKPDVRIFQHVLRELGLPAERCVFMDDVPRNVDAAIGLGMQGVVVDAIPTAVAAIEELLNSRR